MAGIHQILARKRPGFRPVFTQVETELAARLGGPPAYFFPCSRGFLCYFGFALEQGGGIFVNPRVIRILFVWLSLIVGASPAVPAFQTGELPPALQREFRGAWVATVNNIDWPRKPGLTTELQKAELTGILDRCAQLKLNVVIFQVRPACDAMYSSKLEPWSEYLTGVQGQAPTPYWDPLEFAIREAHARGLELHAWFNPFRARHSTGFSPLAKSHISKTHPNWVKSYGTHLWLDPGLKEVHDYSAKVILDVVKRYDIDGVHIDDYFYPYREKDSSGREIPFPDWPSWTAYQKSGGKLPRDDWRRDNVNRFVQRLYRDVHASKAWVKVGISPFGIYRPGFPAQIRGFDQYESLFADPRYWLSHGWLDYLAPQLYWRVEPSAQSFPVLLRWWAENNPKHRLIVPGINSAAVGTGSNPWPAAEIVRQVELSRRQSGAAGHIHWNMSALLRNRAELTSQLARESYAQSALVPPLPGREGKVNLIPVLKSKPGSKRWRLEWALEKGGGVRFWVVQARKNGVWQTEVLPSVVGGREFSELSDLVAVTALDAFGNLGETRTQIRP